MRYPETLNEVSAGSDTNSGIDTTDIKRRVSSDDIISMDLAYFWRWEKPELPEKNNKNTTSSAPNFYEGQKSASN